jgi:hypothetical protein
MSAIGQIENLQKSVLFSVLPKVFTTVGFRVPQSDPSYWHCVKFRRPFLKYMSK